MQPHIQHNVNISTGIQNLRPTGSFDYEQSGAVQTKTELIRIHKKFAYNFIWDLWNWKKFCKLQLVKEKLLDYALSLSVYFHLTRCIKRQKTMVVA